MATTFPDHAVPRASTSRDRTNGTYRHLALWTLQGWIAMFFIAAGYAKLTEPMDILVHMLGWPELSDAAFVHGLGMLEISLAIGVLAPLVSWRFGRPVLMVSALALALLETLTLVFHALRGEPALVVVNFLLLAITIPVLVFRRAGPARRRPRLAPSACGA